MVSIAAQGDVTGSTDVGVNTTFAQMPAETGEESPLSVIRPALCPTVVLLLHPFGGCAAWPKIGGTHLHHPVEGGLRHPLRKK